MATDLDICNLALAHLGDDATVASIDPPEGSIQAAHCARFYPVARDSLLEMHNWGFTTTRIALSLLAATPLSGWVYAYAQPSDAINLLGVFIPGSTDDFNPQDFETETLADGTNVIYSNTQSAVLRYTRHVTDPSQFSPLFTDALGWLLASMLAGPLLKGTTGAQATVQSYKMFLAQFGKAAASDAGQRRVRPQDNPSWLKGRGPVPINLLPGWPR